MSSVQRGPAVRGNHSSARREFDPRAGGSQSVRGRGRGSSDAATELPLVGLVRWWGGATAAPPGSHARLFR